MRPQIMYRLSGRFEGLRENARYSVTELSQASGIQLETLRERLARRHCRAIVLPSDLAPIGSYNKILVLLETDAEVLSQSWLSKPLADQNTINWLMEDQHGYS